MAVVNDNPNKIEVFRQNKIVEAMWYIGSMKIIEEGNRI